MLPPARPGLRLSIVIAAWNGPRSLERCLLSLREDARACDTEVIVATNFDAAEMLAGRFPYVRHLALPSDTTVPVLRTAGIRLSEGKIVALAEDHCTFGADWCAEIKNAHLSSYFAVGGAVENASVERALDWAVYFYDYGRFMLPSRPGIVRWLAGNNVSYRREILREIEPAFQDGFFEPFTHAEIEKLGHRLYSIPSAVVYHYKSYETKSAVVRSYHLARGYAAKRVLDAPLIRRGQFVMTSLALPVLLTGRIAVRTVRKGRLIAEMCRSLPYLLLLLSSWSLGEFCGYVAGAGRSAGAWR